MRSRVSATKWRNEIAMNFIFTRYDELYAKIVYRTLKRIRLYLYYYNIVREWHFFFFFLYNFFIKTFGVVIIPPVLTFALKKTTIGVGHNQKNEYGSIIAFDQLRFVPCRDVFHERRFHFFHHVTRRIILNTLRNKNRCLSPCLHFLPTPIFFMISVLRFRLSPVYIYFVISQNDHLSRRS